MDLLPSSHSYTSPISIPNGRQDARTLDSRATTLADPEEWSQFSPTQSVPFSRPKPLSHTDSGYVTGNNTSFVSPVGSSERLHKKSLPEEKTTVTRSVPLPGKEDLQIFRTDVDCTFNARFREIAPEIQRLLYQGIQKGGLSFFHSSRAKTKKQAMTMSMRLMVVGEAIESARPAIVVFVSGEGVGKIESALDQDLLKQLYCPDDGITPCFDVVVVGQAPRKRLRQDVEVVWDTNLSGERELMTYCGVQLYMRTHDRKSAMATVGGVVKVTYGPGDFKLVGMTAGHVLEDLWPKEDEPAEMDEGSGETQPSGFMYPRVIGTILYPRPAALQDDVVPPRDWALFEVDNAFKVRPNRLQRAEHSAHRTHRSDSGAGMLNDRSVKTAPPRSFPEIEPIEVVLLNGSGGSVFGALSHLSGGLLLAPEHGFVEAYMLVLDDGQEIADGDSGSWVVNPVSMEVYGHVVATDMTGDGYMIPLHSTLDEMRDLLGVESVELPRTADLLDAALRATLGGFGSLTSGLQGRVPDHWEPLVINHTRIELHERRASEVFLLCGGWGLQDLKTESVFDDGDSGYGSLGSEPRSSTPFTAMIGSEEEEVEFSSY